MTNDSGIPDGSTDITEDDKQYTEDLADGSKQGLVDDSEQSDDSEVSDGAES
ncbi:hypothetical protein [Frigoribacterium sp. Leaf186]|jgi:hypothetical protein|uniref:hypothetical protein n=1 Tax=Frigoribacterium sp. Leaf186 TaxID=1736293 RepID=UPI000A7DA5E9|nr:hypothetical protein [Frigoribacterium sp. Leaf186]